MMQCWQKDPRKRPSFKKLTSTLKTMADSQIDKVSGSADHKKGFVLSCCAHLGKGAIFCYLFIKVVLLKTTISPKVPRLVYSKINSKPSSLPVGESQLVEMTQRTSLIAILKLINFCSICSVCSPTCDYCLNQRSTCT